MKRKIVSMMLTMGLCVLAGAPFASADKKGLDFWAYAGGTPGYSETNPKSDNEAYAYVTTQGTTMVSGDKLRYSVSNSAKTKEVSDHKTVEGATTLNRQKIKYLSGYNVKGRKYRLKVKSYTYSTHVKGRWNS